MLTFLVNYKRVGPHRDFRRVYDARRIEDLQGIIEDDVKDILDGKNVIVSINDLDANPIEGSLDYGLTGQFTVQR